MLVLHRIALPTINAILITLALLYAMFLLVNIVEPELMPKQATAIVDFVYSPEDEVVKTKIKKPELPKEAEIPPQIIVDNVIIDDVVDTSTQWLGEDQFGHTKQVLTAIENSQLILAIGYPPQYPASAVSRGIEGYAVVGFSVDSTGSVYDAFIIESEPGNTFDRVSLKAIMKFKYKARKVDGQTVNTDGQRYMFSYKMDS